MVLPIIEVSLVSPIDYREYKKMVHSQEDQSTPASRLQDLINDFLAITTYTKIREKVTHELLPLTIHK